MLLGDKASGTYPPFQGVHELANLLLAGPFGPLVVDIVSDHADRVSAGVRRRANASAFQRTYSLKSAPWYEVSVHKTSAKPGWLGAGVPGMRDMVRL